MIKSHHSESISNSFMDTVRNQISSKSSMSMPGCSSSLRSRIGFDGERLRDGNVLAVANIGMKFMEDIKAEASCPSSSNGSKGGIAS